MSAPLRILVLDGNPRVSVGASYARAFIALGHEAHFLDNARWFGWSNPSVLARAARRLTYPAAVSAYNAYVLAQAARLRPDFLSAAALQARSRARSRHFGGGFVLA